MKDEKTLHLVLKGRRIRSMKTVYKYHISATDYQTIELPIGAEILKVDSQNNEMQMWALVAPNAETEKRNFRVVGTGREISDDEASDLRYVGTCILYDGRVVFHVFEIIKLNF